MTLNYNCQLSADCCLYAEEELGENEESRQKNVSEILIWLDENPHINANRDVKHLLYFLRGAKFNADKAKKKIQCYYRMRAERTEWFSNRNPFLPEIDELLKIGVFLPLKEKDEYNQLVVIIRTAAHDPKKHTQNNVFKIGKMLLDLVLKMDESVSVYGVSAIFDMKGVTLSHALQLHPALIKRSVESWENYSCRARHLEFVNAPSHVNAVLNIFRTFMSAKMKKRICVTKGPPVPRPILPIDLGGNGDSYEMLSNYWRKLAHQNAEWFRENEIYKTII